MPHADVCVVSASCVVLACVLPCRALIREWKGACLLRGSIIVVDDEEATDGDREAVTRWGTGRREIASLDVGPLVDLAEVG